MKGFADQPQGLWLVEFLQLLAPLGSISASEVSSHSYYPQKIKQVAQIPMLLTTTAHFGLFPAYICLCMRSLESLAKRYHLRIWNSSGKGYVVAISQALSGVTLKVCGREILLMSRMQNNTPSHELYTKMRNGHRLEYICIHRWQKA